MDRLGGGRYVVAPYQVLSPSQAKRPDPVEVEVAVHNRSEIIMPRVVDVYDEGLEGVSCHDKKQTPEIFPFLIPPVRQESLGRSANGDPRACDCAVSVSSLGFPIAGMSSAAHNRDD